MVLTEMSDRQIQEAMGVRLRIARRGGVRPYEEQLRPQERARNMRAQGKLFLVTPGMQMPTTRHTRRKSPMFLERPAPQAPTRYSARVLMMPLRQDKSAPRRNPATGSWAGRFSRAILDWLNPRMYPAR